MPTTLGYVGTIEAETRAKNRLWFGLTDEAASKHWVKIGQHRAWFTMNMESTKDRPTHMAQLTLLLEALRSALHVEVSHGGALDIQHSADEDSFEVNGIKILRADLHFGLNP